MRIVGAIARQQLRQAFGRPLAVVVLALFLGWLTLTTLWIDDLLAAGVASMRRPFFWMAAALTVVGPALTMRSVAEERRSGALQVVGTWPVTPTQLILGKWLGSVGVVCVGLALTVGWPLGLAWLGPLDPGPVLAGYLGMVLLGGLATAVGTAASAWSRHQVLAFLVGFAVLLLPWLLGLALPLLGADLAWLEGLAVGTHLDRLVRGVVDSRTVVALVGAIAVSLRAAVLALEQERLA